MKTRLLITICLTISFQAFSQFTTTTMVSGLAYPVSFDWMSTNGNYLITLKGGASFPAVNAKVQVYTPTGVFVNTFCDLSDSTNADFERGVLGVCCDYNFFFNHYVYVYYNHRFNNDERMRVVRYVESGNVGTNPTVILDIDVANSIAGNHVGGNMRMRANDPDKLYIAIGELGIPSNAQLLTNPYGKILRIATDGSIPTDNPFYDNGIPTSGNDDRIWSYGHRNPFDLCVSPVNDSIYSSENGQNTWDEANMISRGNNYGWSTCEGNHLTGSTTNPCTNPLFTPAITTWPSPLPSVTGIMIYSGSVIPQYDNHMLVADNNYGRIYNCTLGNAPVYNTVTSNVLWMDVTTSDGLTTLKQGADGCVYAMKGGYTTSGAVYRICPTGVTGTGGEIKTIHEPVLAPSVLQDNTTLVKFILQQPSAIKICIANVHGRTVMTYDAGKLNTGLQQINLDVSTLDAGTYFVKIQASAAQETLKLVRINH